MRTLCLALALSTGALLSISAAHAGSKPPVNQKLNVAQLDQMLAAAHAETDADLAEQLSSLELTERLGTRQLTRLTGTLPGEKSHDALLLLADKSAFLPPPPGDVPSDPAPDPASTRQMLVKMVNYVNTTLRQLPNLIAARDTTGFEDRPQEDALEATGIVSYSYQPLHFAGESIDSVTFRDRKEVVDTNLRASTKRGSKVGGLSTSGEFGPILSTVLGDALKGKISWDRWERGATRTLAVFHYEVPEGKSNYRVRFCCIVDGLNQDGTPNQRPFDEKTAYHGEIAFDPSDGTIMRMALEADLPRESLVPKAGMVVEYAPVEIAGKNYICPIKGISLLAAHINQPHGMYSQVSYKGPAKTFLNDVAFGNYRRFGSESRILSGENPPPQ